MENTEFKVGWVYQNKKKEVFEIIEIKDERYPYPILTVLLGSIWLLSAFKPDGRYHPHPSDMDLILETGKPKESIPSMTDSETPLFTRKAKITVDFNYEYLGKFPLKNIKESIKHDCSRMTFDILEDWALAEQPIEYSCNRKFPLMFDSNNLPQLTLTLDIPFTLSLTEKGYHLSFGEKESYSFTHFIEEVVDKLSDKIWCQLNVEIFNSLKKTAKQDKP